MAVALGLASPLGATTVVPLGFTEVAASAAVIVEGTVIGLDAVSNGQPIPSAGEKMSASPASEPEPALPEDIDTDSQADAAAEAGTEAVPPAPAAVGVEGGEMVFTEVEMAVEDAVAGSAGSVITFWVAGGETQDGVVTVHGLPTFELGGRYLVFLRHGFENAGDPLVGVHQGFFRVVRQDSGEEMLLNANSDIVIAIENDSVIVRRNPQSEDSGRQLAPLPVPETGSPVQPSTSPEVERYWLSTEPAMDPTDFKAAVRAARGDAS
jgi:hypothetical protein